MRKIIISFCILFAALSLQAQSVNGIRIDGGNTPILVYLGGCLSSVHPFSYCIHYILLATDCQFRHKKALRKGGLAQSKS